MLLTNVSRFLELEEFVSRFTGNCFSISREYFSSSVLLEKRDERYLSFTLCCDLSSSDSNEIEVQEEEGGKDTQKE
jgi:hypothetical protein